MIQGRQRAPAHFPEAAAGGLPFAVGRMRIDFVCFYLVILLVMERTSFVVPWDAVPAAALESSINWMDVKASVTAPRRAAPQPSKMRRKNEEGRHLYPGEWSNDDDIHIRAAVNRVCRRNTINVVTKSFCRGLAMFTSRL